MAEDKVGKRERGNRAEKQGIPGGHLVAARNGNDVLHEFVTTGTNHVSPAARVAVTSSPRMDVGKASNFERYLYLVAGSDAVQTAGWWDEVGAGRPVDLQGTPHWAAIEDSGFRAGRSTHADRLATIRRVDEQFGRLIDPHTADGVLVGQGFQRPGVPMVCLETALPVKFEETVREAVGRAPERPGRFAGIETRERFCDVLPNDVAALKAYLADKLD